MVLLAFIAGVLIAYNLRRLPTIGRYEAFLLYGFFMAPLSFAAPYLVADETYAIVPTLVAWLLVVVLTKRSNAYGVLEAKGYLRIVLMNHQNGTLVNSPTDIEKIDKLIIDQDFNAVEGKSEAFVREIFQSAARNDVELININDYLTEEYGYVNYMRKSHRIELRKRNVFDAVKNSFDRTLALVALIALIPLFALIGLAIFLADGRPIIFSQTRLGKGGRLFKIIKFRSLRKDNVTPIRWKLGSLLRVSHFDELPQLWNVLKGDMAIVGPRPEWLSLASDQEAPKGYWMRTAIRPGITGWAQVNYRPSRTKHTRNRKLGYDIFYINHRGILLDALVWLRTFQRFAFFLSTLFNRKARSRSI